MLSFMRFFYCVCLEIGNCFFRTLGYFFIGQRNCPFPNIAINKQMVRKKLIKVFIWCDEKWHQEVEYQKFDFYFQSGIRRLRFWGTEMVFGGTEMVLGVRKWFGGTEMVFNDYKSQPPDATFHYFDIVVGNAYWVFSLIWSYVL